MTEIGQIEAIYRYPVKSMRGELLEAATLGWHGLDGDRRLALRRIAERGDFPWLSASKLPELVLFTPLGDGRVRTPEGEDLPAFSAELAAEISRRYGSPVEMMQLRHGIFDEGSVSVITSSTVAELCRRAETAPDVRRFRPNIVVRSRTGIPFEEDRWVGRTLLLGDTALSVTLRDERCAMVNYDPDDARTNPAVMKAAVRANANHAGIYGTVTRIGGLAVGQTVGLR
ncbi:MAG TPA: MOSC N-terminal beta barrel domain-containing protein [Kofleriaceae bacterium]